MLAHVVKVVLVRLHVCNGFIDSLIVVVVVVVVFVVVLVVVVVVVVVVDF